MSLFGRYYFAGRLAAAFDAAEVGAFDAPGPGDVWSPPTDVAEFPDGWLVRMELVGVAPGDVQVRVSPRRLAVTGIRRPWSPPHGRPVYRQMEMRHGLFSRTVAWNGAARTPAVRATLCDGLLEVTLPRAPHADETPVADAEGWRVVAL